MGAFSAIKRPLMGIPIMGNDLLPSNINSYFRLISLAGVIDNDIIMPQFRFIPSYLGVNVSFIPGWIVS
jgi:hypothetical protein